MTAPDDLSLVREAIGVYEDQTGETQRLCDSARAALDRLQSRIEALNCENADLNAENRNLFEKWSEAKARDPQQVEYLTSLAEAEARIERLEEALRVCPYCSVAHLVADARAALAATEEEAPHA